MDHPTYHTSTKLHLHLFVGLGRKIGKKKKNPTNLKATIQPASSTATQFLQILQWLSYPMP